MSSRNRTSVLEKIENAFGLPPLSRTFDKIPDSRQIKEVKDLFVLAEKLSQNAPDLDKLVTLVHLLNDIPMEKLAMLEKVLKRLESIVKHAPAELFDVLNELKG